MLVLLNNRVVLRILFDIEEFLLKVCQAHQEISDLSRASSPDRST
jgi:hypothetical protein